MKMIGKILAIAIMAAGALGASNSANAISISMMAFDGNWDARAVGWAYVITNEDPGGRRTCADHGYHWHTEGYLTAVQMNPPFSGDKRKTRYITLCNDNDNGFITIKLEVRLSDCAAWVCGKHWSWDEVNRNHMTYDHSWGGLTNKSLDLLLNPD